MATHLNVSMAFIPGLISFMGNIFEITPTCPFKKLLNILMKFSLIVFEAQNILCALIDSKIVWSFQLPCSAISINFRQHQTHSAQIPTARNKLTNLDTCTANPALKGTRSRLLLLIIKKLKNTRLN
jgi:hypothetical protein